MPMKVHVSAVQPGEFKQVVSGKGPVMAPHTIDAVAARRDIDFEEAIASFKK